MVTEGKMLEVTINEPELHGIEQIRMGLSEREADVRETAILNIKHDIMGVRIALLKDRYGPDWTSEPANADLSKWITDTGEERQEAMVSMMDTSKRYEANNEFRLNVAERIGKCIVASIDAGKFEGVQSLTGILAQVRDEAKKAKIRGAVDKDVLRRIWKDYRGVVHLGMAIDYCGGNPLARADVLRVAEQVRCLLSEKCPKGTSKPYVDPRKQIKFVYLSKLSGPRFRNRGLPFYVS